MDTELRLPKRPVKIGSGFVFSILERAIHEGMSRRDFGTPQMEQVIAFFGGPPAACVYCGESPQRWDHLVPVREGGETVIGNMVPACGRCDDSKQDLSFEDWWQSSRRYSPLRAGVKDQTERLVRLRAYVAHFGYRPIRLEERLTPEEKVKLREIREAAGILRTRIESLVKMYSERTCIEGAYGE